VRMPDDFAKNIVAGKAYDLRSGEGARIWNDSPFSASASTPRRIQRSAVPSEGLTPFSPWISRASSAEQIGPRPESSRSGGALKRSRLWAGVSRARACTSSPRGEGGRRCRNLPERREDSRARHSPLPAEDPHLQPAHDLRGEGPGGEGHSEDPTPAGRGRPAESRADARPPLARPPLAHVHPPHTLSRSIAFASALADSYAPNRSRYICM
jgi:hypothetical protein